MKNPQKKRLAKLNATKTNRRIYSFISSAGGLISLMRKFFGSAKSATFNVATGFFVPGFGYLRVDKMCEKKMVHILKVTCRSNTNFAKEGKIIQFHVNFSAFCFFLSSCAVEN